MDCVGHWHSMALEDFAGADSYFDGVAANRHSDLPSFLGLGHTERPDEVKHGARKSASTAVSLSTGVLCRHGAVAFDPADHAHPSLSSHAAEKNAKGSKWDVGLVGECGVGMTRADVACLYHADRLVCVSYVPAMLNVVFLMENDG